MSVDPQKAVMTCALVTVASTVGSSVAPTSLCGKGELPSVRLLTGTAFAFAGIGIMADIAPGIAVPFAVSVAITALTYYGIPLLEAYYTDKPCTQIKKESK